MAETQWLFLSRVVQVEHVFSCEIEPFKQGYIERNFAPPILFRDIRELGGEKVPGMQLYCHIRSVNRMPPESKFSESDPLDPHRPLQRMARLLMCRVMSTCWWQARHVWTTGAVPCLLSTTLG